MKTIVNCQILRCLQFYPDTGETRLSYHFFPFWDDANDWKKEHCDDYFIIERVPFYCMNFSERAYVYDICPRRFKYEKL